MRYLVIASLAVATFFSTMGCNTAAKAQDLNTQLRDLYACVDAILLGPTRNGIKVFGHQLNCKKGRINYSAEDDTLWVTGIISIHRARFSDPQTLISFHVFPDGSTSHIEYFTGPNIARGWATKGYESRADIQQWRRGWAQRQPGHGFNVGYYVAMEAAARVSDSRMRAVADIKTGELEYFIDRPGGDMSRRVIDGDARDCLRRCYQDNACRAWTWVRPGVQEDRAVCWLKNATQNDRVRFNPDTISGLKSGYALME